MSVGYGQKKYSLAGMQRPAGWDAVGGIEQPDRLVKKAAALLWSERWEDIVVGLALSTGRCVPEVLKTGVMVPRKPYSLLFAAEQEQVDAVLGPFEIPT
jgi:hypothetical protein